MSHDSRSSTPSAAPAARPGAVEFRNITKQYGSLTVVNGISLQISGGEFISLLGPSGSGKTTLLMMLAGFTEPSAGQIMVDGQRTDQIPANRRNQGVVFQSYALFPHMTVRDNVAFPLKARGVPEARARELIRTALMRVRMAGFEDRYPSQLSGGQQQRVALARATVFDPPLILMDESLSALDRKLRQEMQVEIKDLHRELGKTIIYVTHDQEEALTLSDRIVVLQNGRIAQVGAPMDIYERPRSIYVASFIGEANFIDGVVEQQAGDRLQVATLAGTVEVASDRPWRSGEAVRIMIRPEALQIRGSSNGAGTSSGLRGRVTQVSFIGDALIYRIAVAGQSFVAKSVRSRRGAVLQIGDFAEMSFHADDVRVFGADSSLN
ncbi:ABC transporter ATP-binding protein [Variovorax terrae]|uniref:Spermidine/putrescine import ATP-binding protein PotA n=1 Tax=Variovorax terrae TaxID=2923278 RepID=A0A9X2AKN4_9BURK|nr:ABC transporter ATP-binding protein [Variovorax terrae]MCJ0761673.1 ABC transporter ATP-binding protein [Variovorax terrae]